MQQRSFIILTLLSLLVTLAGCVERVRPEPSKLPSADHSSAADALPIEIETPGGISMVLIPAGRYTMGHESEQDARPLHDVTISEFYMDRFEVTQDLYEQIMGKNPARRKGEQNPVERVRWTDALKFCNARSIQEGLTPCYDLEAWACNFAADGYRLPTEAEWEYACRAGSTDDYYFAGGAEQLDTHAWFRDNAGRKHHPVGQKEPNAFGLYDMAGNVREWCNDWYAVDAYSEEPAVNPHGPASGEKAVLRGGAFSSSAESCTSWTRYCDEPGFTDACVASDDYGFRCVRKATQNTRDGTTRRFGVTNPFLYASHRRIPPSDESPCWPRHTATQTSSSLALAVTQTESYSYATPSLILCHRRPLRLFLHHQRRQAVGVQLTSAT